MIIITGAAGFIGSCLAASFNEKNVNELCLVDDFSIESKLPNFNDKKYIFLANRENVFAFLAKHKIKAEVIFHLGARTDTTEFDNELLRKLNFTYSQQVWHYATELQIPLIYASSAATYGMGEFGFDDQKSIAPLQPLNPYGWSKQNFDIWALAQKETPPFWAGLKFFNVYGPNEYHKNRMASVIFHAYKQIKTKGEVKLFKSHHPDYRDGEQLRDFIYVKDIVRICQFIYAQHKHIPSGIYNAGTGKARTFLDLALACFAALDQAPNIHFIDTPADIRDKYQYYTCATTKKLEEIGFSTDFYTLEDGVRAYVQMYLEPQKYW
ncbi:MAG: ADP-glyceromanno-heptose 6-epimerase [Chitinophagales bacterium]|nr:ADP-glyceromanno-heptose 6-epimerase [Bacteroidota bacterium]MCB9044067.1 ADP-glyceromanno-heptose 6-epimerase [Chitinophagales bacterium]